MEDVHICACNTRSMSHHSIFQVQSNIGTLQLFTCLCQTMIFLICDWNWILWYFSLAIPIESMVLDGLVAQRDLGSFGIASTPPTLDLTFRYGFTILREFPLHNTCKEWWPWERSQGSQMCWDSNLFWFIPGTVHETNGWRHAGQWQTWICPCFLPDI
jgi:hypothetical protein